MIDSASFDMPDARRIAAAVRFFEQEGAREKRHPRARRHGTGGTDVPVSGYTGTFSVVVDITFNEAGCVESFETWSLTFEDGLLKTVST